MAEAVKMPKMSDTMTEGVLAKWHKKIGDIVKTGDLVAEIETDKATMDFESFQEGTLLYMGPKEGEAVPVDGLIAILGKAGEDISALIGGSAASASPAPVQESTADKEPSLNQVLATAGISTSSISVEPEKVQYSENGHNESRIKASPLARKIAEEKGIDLSHIKGSAEQGRIVKKDLDTLVLTPQAESKAPVIASNPALSYEDFPVSQMRKTIAKRLSESLFTAPHFYLTMSIDMDKSIELRKQINESASVKISFNDLVLKAVAHSLKSHPKINSSWLGDKIRVNHTINIGVAVAVDEGLLVPVIRNADQKGLSQISLEVKDFVGKAKDKKLQPADWEGSTFTISNLGMFGLDEFTAIINTPDACILAIGGIQAVPVVKNQQVVPGNIMKVTLSCDHRVVDGATGAAFLQTLKELLESPLKILI
jgi:pyruvate dehydrogenase E2 component (dihydrolipoamide acetyltransferase)